MLSVQSVSSTFFHMDSAKAIVVGVVVSGLRPNEAVGVPRLAPRTPITILTLHIRRSPQQWEHSKTT
jgi:hypothetical protein